MSWVTHWPNALNKILCKDEDFSSFDNTVVLIFLAGGSGFPSEPFRKPQESFEKSKNEFYFISTKHALDRKI